MLIEQCPWAPSDLWNRVKIPNIDEADSQRILNNAADVIYSDRGRAQQMMQTRHFRDWILTPNSARLLVHGDFDNTNKISPFSVLAATVFQGLRTSSSVISLVFFCGQHLRTDEYNGGNAIIRSFVAQLVRQFRSSTITPAHDKSLYDVAIGNTSRLCTLFVYLIVQLPPDITVFCLIDGINEYEREEYLHDMEDVVLTLLGLVEQSSRPSFKLLLLSPRPTLEVRKAFDDEPDMLLHMERLPVIEDVVGPAQIHEMIRM
jgi:hypothetical protein